MHLDDKDKSDKKAIRQQYEAWGVDAYYRKFGADYFNPHFQQVRQLLIQNQERIDYRVALDFCCGAGEVTQVLTELGFPETQGCDPFTQLAFQKNTGKVALSFTFAEVLRGALHGQWSSIICSFALHLCPEDQLFPLCYQLFQCSEQLVVISPHKRPQLEKLEGFHLEFLDHCLTDKGKKVFLKSYRWG